MVFQQFKDRYCAGIDRWCAENKDAHFIGVTHQATPTLTNDNIRAVLHRRFDQLVAHAYSQRKLACLTLLDNIENEDMSYDYQGKDILVGSCVGAFLPVDVLYEVALMEPDTTPVKHIDYQDFLENFDRLIPLRHYDNRHLSYVIHRDGYPILGFSTPHFLFDLRITEDGKIEYSDERKRQWAGLPQYETEEERQAGLEAAEKLKYLVEDAEYDLMKDVDDFDQMQLSSFLEGICRHLGEGFRREDFRRAVYRSVIRDPINRSSAPLQSPTGPQDGVS